MRSIRSAIFVAATIVSVVLSIQSGALGAVPSTDAGPEGTGVPIGFGDDTISPPAGVKSARQLTRTQQVGAASGSHVLYFNSVTLTDDTTDDSGTQGLSEANARAAVAEIDRYWSAESRGLVHFSFGGLATSALHGASGTCESHAALDNQSRSLSASGGAFAGTAWFGSNAHLIVMPSEPCGGAFGTIGGPGGGLVYSSGGLAGRSSVETLEHELGHNLGFDHAGSSMCRNTTTFDDVASAFGNNADAACPNEAYGDFLDIMGYTVDGAHPHVSTPARIRLGYLASDQVAVITRDVRMNPVAITLAPIGSDSGITAIRVVDPDTGESYFVEFRPKIGDDATSAEYNWGFQCNPLVDTFKKCRLGSSSTSGAVRILRQLPGSDATTVLATSVVDGSPTKRRGNLGAGESFTGHSGQFTISVISSDQSGSAQIAVTFRTSTTATSVIADKNAVQSFGAKYPVRLTAHSVTATAGPIAGTVEFFDGTKSLGTVPSLVGDATLRLHPATAVGRHTISARFTPTDPVFDSSTSSARTVTVNRGTPAVVLALDRKTISRTGNAKATVAVSLGSPVHVTGRVKVYVDDHLVRIVTLAPQAGGAVRFAIPKISLAGTHRVSVRYLGDTNILPRSSAHISLRVTTR